MYKYKFLTSFLITALLFLPLGNNYPQAKTDPFLNAPPATTPGWTFTGKQSGCGD
jgi:hypothetical protein